MEGKIRVTVIATGFENKAKVKPEPVVAPVIEQPIIKDENVIDSSEFSKILNNSVSNTETKTETSNPFESLNGSFVSKNDLNSGSYGTFTSSNQNSSKNEGEQSKNAAWGQSLFDLDSHKGGVNPATKSFAPPPGFEPNSNDLSQPAIWNNSNFGRTINLSDD